MSGVALIEILTDVVREKVVEMVRPLPSTSDL
jgi:hypothetical protein